MNKYIVRATVQVTGLMVLGGVVSFAVITALNYFKPTSADAVVALGLSLMAFALYQLIQIRASALEYKDRLKEHKTK